MSPTRQKSRSDFWTINDTIHVKKFACVKQMEVLDLDSSELRDVRSKQLVRAKDLTKIVIMKKAMCLIIIQLEF